MLPFFFWPERMLPFESKVLTNMCVCTNITSTLHLTETSHCSNKENQIMAKVMEINPGMGNEIIDLEFTLILYGAHIFKPQDPISSLR